MAIMKTLVIRPADVSLNPIGAGSSVADARVSVVYDRDVWVDGQPMPRVPLISTSIPTTGLRVPVLASDDPSITEGAGFVIKVVVETTTRIGQHNDSGTSLARTIQVVAADPDEIPLGSKPNLTPVPDPTQYADVMSAIKAAAETKAAAARVEASAAAAKQSAQAAEQASSQAVTLAQNANAGTDRGVAGLLGQAGSQTQAAGDARWRGKDAMPTLMFEDRLGAGVTDHTAALRAFIAECRTKKARGVLGYGKTYMVSDTVDTTGGFSLDGMGATIKVAPRSSAAPTIFQPMASPYELVNVVIDGNSSNVAPTPDGASEALIYAYVPSGWAGKAVLRNIEFINPSNTTAIRIGAPAPDPRTSGENSGFRDPRDSRNISTRIEQVDATGSYVGVWIAYASGVTMDGIDCGGGEHGILDYGSYGTTIRNTRVDNVRGNGISTLYSYGFSMSDTRTERSGLIGVAVGGGDPEWVPACNFTISNTLATRSGHHGFAVDTTLTTTAAFQDAHGTITGCIARNNTMHGVYLNNGNFISADAVATGNGIAGFAVFGNNISLSGVATGNQTGVDVQADDTRQCIGLRSTVSTRGNTFRDYSFPPQAGGVYRISLMGSGGPSGAHVGAPGVDYIDTKTGDFYVYKGAPGTSSGWVKVA